MLVQLFGESAITFRAALGAVLSFVICVIGFPWLIKLLSKKGAVESHEKGDSQVLDKLVAHKKNTPTMGGILVVLSIAISCLLFADFKNPAVLVVLFVLISMGAIGLIDDMMKLRKGKGLSVSAKLILQIIVGYAAAFAASHVLIAQDPQNGTKLFLPFDGHIELGAAIVLIIMIMTVGTSNAVNITDGLDGLATGCFTIAAFACAIICYIVSRIDFSQHLGLPHILTASELTIVCGAMVGACLGFLWFNAYPAQIFMGDCGSLALGGTLGIIASFARQELLVIMVGAVFMLEALSSFLQVLIYKLTGKRLFRIAPLHHSYQFKGIHEAKITTRFWILALVVCVLALSTLKLR